MLNCSLIILYTLIKLTIKYKLSSIFFFKKEKIMIFKISKLKSKNTIAPP